MSCTHGHDFAPRPKGLRVHPGWLWCPSCRALYPPRVGQCRKERGHAGGHDWTEDRSPPWGTIAFGALRCLVYPATTKTGGDRG